jgi:disulfide bond formation protein DsbB
VRLYARIALLLGGFLLAAGLVYGGTNKERIGLVLLLVAGAGFAYLGLYARRVIRAAERVPPEAAGAEPGGQAHGAAKPEGAGAQVPAEGGAHVEEVRPTIWPLVFSLAGAAIVAGVLVSHWILLAGGLLAVAAAAGWFFEVLIQRQQHP